MFVFGIPSFKLASSLLLGCERTGSLRVVVKMLSRKLNKSFQVARLITTHIQSRLASTEALQKKVRIVYYFFHFKS